MKCKCLVNIFRYWRKARNRAKPCDAHYLGGSIYIPCVYAFATCTHTRIFLQLTEAECQSILMCTSWIFEKARGCITWATIPSRRDSENVVKAKSGLYSLRGFYTWRKHIETTFYRDDLRTYAYLYENTLCLSYSTTRWYVPSISSLDYSYCYMYTNIYIISSRFFVLYIYIYYKFVINISDLTFVGYNPFGY